MTGAGDRVACWELPHGLVQSCPTTCMKACGSSTLTNRQWANVPSVNYILVSCFFELQQDAILISITDVHAQGLSLCLVLISHFLIIETISTCQLFGTCTNNTRRVDERHTNKHTSTHTSFQSTALQVLHASLSTKGPVQEVIFK